LALNGHRIGDRALSTRLNNSELVSAGWISGAVALLWIPVAMSAGMFADDLILSAWVSKTSWTTILSGEAGPFILYMLYWKALLPLNPENPFQIAHVFTGILHGIHCGILYLLFRTFLTRKQALLCALAASVYRSGSEALVWAAAINDVLIGMLTALTVFLWAKGKTDRNYRWLSLLPYTIALTAKPSAAGIPGICLAWTLFMETNGPVRIRLRSILAPAGAMGVLGALCGANAYLRPGYWAPIYPRELPHGDLFTRMGEALSRGFIFFSPETLYESRATGYASLAICLILLLVPSGKVRAGLLWAVCIQIVPVAVSAAAGSRYGYPATGGFICATAGIVEAVASSRLMQGNRRRQLISAAIALWMALSVLFLAWDVRCRITWGKLYAETRQLLHRHRREIESAATITSVRLPRILPYWQIIEYDFGIKPPYNLNAGQCPGDGTPCLVFRREFPVSIRTSYIRGDEWPFVEWGEKP